MAQAAQGDRDELEQVDAEMAADDEADKGDLASNLDWDDDTEAEDEDTSNDV